MADVPEPYRKHFLGVLYDQYQKAKNKNDPETWARAVHCREYLQKIGGPDKEADTFQEVFAGFGIKEEVAERYRELCEDSRSYSQN
jgi:hypothetical protein